MNGDELDIGLGEIPAALICCYLGDDPRELIILGTQIPSKEKDGREFGFLRVFSLTKVSLYITDNPNKTSDDRKQINRFLIHCLTTFNLPFLFFIEQWS